MVNRAGDSKENDDYQHRNTNEGTRMTSSSRMLAEQNDRGWESDQESINENDHVWQDVDLNGSLDDGIGDFRTPGLCTFKRNEITRNRYQYRGIYHKSSLQYVPRTGVSRYGNALKTLIPIRRLKKNKERLGVDDAGLLSFITFSWLSKFMYQAYRKGLTLDDIPEGSPYDSCDYNAQRLEAYWTEELAEKGSVDASLGKVVWKFIRTRILLSSLVFACNLMTGFISVTICLRSLIVYAERPDAPISEGIKWAVLLTVAEICRTVFYSTTWAISYRTAARLRSACLALLYKKVIRLNSVGDQSIGQLINLFSNDSQRIFDMVLFGPMIMGGPITMTFGICYILWLLGPYALMGMLIFTVFYPVQYAMSRCTGYFRAKTLAVGDRRIRLVSEILECIKLIKMYAWEKCFCKNLSQIREREMHLLHITAYSQSLTMSLATTVPIISAIATFLSHIAAGNNLTASEAFSVKTFCLKMLDPLLVFSSVGWTALYDSFVSMQRIQKVLLLDEIKVCIGRPMDRTQAVCIADGSFSHGSPLPQYVKGKNPPNQKKSKNNSKEKENDKKQNTVKYENAVMTQVAEIDVLRNVNFSAQKGHLIGVCGHVGSGKTSLLMACLGQLKVTSGRVFREGSCAYVSQQAWILNATMKENVLFGEKFNPNSYWKVLNCCSLNDDINLLVGGDETEIGERGINLSGGQKQRVALARALYADRDIYFLDDPLSAVDANVGAHIFNHYILDALKDKTVIFVTHQIQFLNRCNEIYVMKDGQIVEKGTHEALLSSNGEYASMVKTWENSQSEQPHGEGIEVLQDEELNHVRFSPVNAQDVDAKGKEELKETTPKKQQNGNGNIVEPTGGALTKKEQTETGALHTDTYLSYMKAAGGLCISLFLILIMLFNVGTLAFSSWWLALWIKAGSGGTEIDVGNNKTVISPNIADNPDFEMYRNVYAGTVGIIVVSNLLRGFAFTKITLKASKTLHNQLFQKVMYSPMLFFEQTPMGRVQNLFSKDVDEVDARLPITLESLLQDGWSLIFAILFICLVFQWFIVPLSILLVLYYCISRIFRVAIRDLKRYENITRSPIFSSVAETVQGLETIHAFGKEADFTRKFTKIFDQNTTCLYMCCIAMRWLSLRIDTLSVMITSITAGLVIIFHGQVPPALAGLAVAYSSTISGIFQYTIRLMTEAETRFISVERMTGYLHSLQREGGHGHRDKPPENWPKQGSIKFNNVCLQYRTGLPLVLKNVTFKIQHGEKIGIVGRTGSGKSSLTVALFRLVELCGGSIKVDNVDIATLNLEQLRSHLSIIPQDPVLFSGTVRSNLDPFGQATDADLWEVLEKTHLKERISLGNGGLDSEVGLSGDKLSVGERQLLCLARALLRKSKIVVLDEATAAVDPDTEADVQATIGTEFEHCTVLTIAHRLATITSCNRIILMDEGRVAEIDTPAALLDNPHSKFSQMMEAAKEANSLQPAGS